MNRFKKWLYSSDYTLQERMFLAGGLIGCIALLGAFIISVAYNEHHKLLIGSGVGAGFVIVLLATIFCYRTRRITLGASIVVLVTNGIVLPIGYLFGGGVHSGSPTWFVLCVAFVFMIFRGKLFVFFLLYSIAAFGIATYIGAAYPEIVVPLSSPDLIYWDTSLAAIIIAIAVGLMLMYQGRLFEKENRIAAARAEEVDRLNESQNRFFASMSHEIRTPINTIIGLNEMILREQQISEEVSENAQNIQNASKVLLALINDVLDMSKIESGRMEVVPTQYETGRMLSDIVNLLWARAREKNLQFDINVGDDIPSMLYGDEMRIKQVIINLVTNAIKYTEEGSVTLSVGGEKTATNEFELHVDVTDTGVGIRKENLPYIFDAFKRVDLTENQAIEGTGLGLAISKQLVDLMGGTISVDSIFTKGSTFRVDLKQQIVDETAMNFTSIKEESKGEGYQQIFEAPEAHVLIVDDNDMNRMVARKLLRGTKVQIDLASSGQECLDKTRDKHYDVIFMDHEMPEMDGIETLQRVRDQLNGLCKETPVVALTANAGSDMNDFYINNGFQAYLAKPIHGSLLEATLLQFLPSELVEKRMATPQEGEILRVMQSRRKRPVIITTDTVCDLPEELVARYSIRVMSYYIVTDSGRFRDTKEIDATNLLAYMEAGGEIKSAAAPVSEYEEFFARALTEAECVIHMTCADALSQGYENATRAAESFGNVVIFDTENLSSGIGLNVLYAAKLVDSGITEPNEVVERTRAYAKRVYCSFIAPSLHTMMKNHPVAVPIRLISEIFHMDPVFKIKKGRIRMRSMHGGYAEESTRKYIRSALRRNRNIDRSILIVPYTGRSVAEMEYIRQEIDACASFEEVWVVPASATISGNVGLKAFGLVFARREGG